MALSKITAASITDNTITNTQINSSAAIAKAKLASLDIVNADINASASIAKTKLASLDIVNADVNASAGIVATKLGTMATANMPVGSIIQVVSLNKTTGHDVQTHMTWTSLYADSDCLKITPTATSSKIIIHYMLDRGNGSISGEAQTDYRIITTIGGSQSNYALSSGVINISNSGYRYGSLGSFTGTVVSPSTTSEITFNIQTRVGNSKKGTLNPYQHSCGITAMEIKG
tara:strand:+ start:163 stop:852 length:690 start_codon:yes stop_codon:yes gene_type:complete